MSKEDKVPSDVYRCEALRKRRVRKGNVEYFVKWREYPESQNTWEPEENILDPALIELFEAKEARKKGRRRSSAGGKTQRKRSTPKSLSGEDESMEEDGDSGKASGISEDVKNGTEEKMDAADSQEPKEEPPGSSDVSEESSKGTVIKFAAKDGEEEGTDAAPPKEPKEESGREKADSLEKSSAEEKNSLPSEELTVAVAPRVVTVVVGDDTVTESVRSVDLVEAPDGTKSVLTSERVTTTTVNDNGVSVAVEVTSQLMDV